MAVQSVGSKTFVHPMLHTPREVEQMCPQEKLPELNTEAPRTVRCTRDIYYTARRSYREKSRSKQNTPHCATPVIFPRAATSHFMYTATCLSYPWRALQKCTPKVNVPNKMSLVQRSCPLRERVGSFLRVQPLPLRPRELNQYVVIAIVAVRYAEQFTEWEPRQNRQQP